jgi:hypothetical protein
MMVNAAYRSEDIPQRMRGNPLIEALPPMLSEREQIAAMANRPAIDLEASRQLPLRQRLWDVDALDELYVPPKVSRQLVDAVDQLIRQSYLARSPQCPVATSRLYDVKSMLAQQQIHKSTLAGAIFLEGLSGMGKTRLVRTVLGRMPQAIRHQTDGAYGLNLTQVVWLSVDAPVGGSMQGLLLRMLMALDEALGCTGNPGAYTPKDTGRMPTVDALIGRFAQAAATHKLGILHVDDFQRVTESQAGREKVLHFIMQLANVIGCPLIFSGTPQTLKVLEKMTAKAGNPEKGFEAARRISSAGHYVLERPKSAEDGDFKNLARALLSFQWLDQAIAKSDQTYEALYKMSCGINSVLVLLHKQAQMIALKNGRNSLELKDYYIAYRTELRGIAPALRRLRHHGATWEQSYELFLESLSRKEEAGVSRAA